MSARQSLLDVQSISVLVPLQAMPLLLPLLLVLAAASCVSSVPVVKRLERCYGDTFSMPVNYLPYLITGKLLFIPSSGGAEQVVIESKKVMDPRYNNSFSTLKLHGVKRHDDGSFWYESGVGPRYEVIRLVIKECGAPLSKSYFDTFRQSPVPFDYVEFATISNPDVETLLWNRSDPEVSRGRVQFLRNAWNLKDLTQADRGFYNFWKKDGTFLHRIKLEVTEHKEEKKVQEGKELYIFYPGFDVSKAFWKVTLINEKSQVLMEDGKWLRPGYDVPEPDFFSRVETTSSTFIVKPVTPAYAGTYEFRDRDGNLILSVEVTVYKAHIPVYFYIAIAVGVILLIVICYCCWKKCCSKKAAPKKATPQLRTYNQDVDQTSAPTYSAHSYSASPAQPPSSQPLNPLSSSGQAPSNNPTFTAPVPSLCLSSDAEPRFELKGLTSAPPLGSDSPSLVTSSDVYKSDKLNFL